MVIQGFPQVVVSDKVLVNGIRECDCDALTVVFDRYSSRVYSTAFKVLRQPDEAEDVMQEVFMQLWHRPECFDGDRGELGAWLSVVAKNRAIDIIRKRRIAIPDEVAVLVSTTDTERVVFGWLEIDRVMSAMVSLTEKQRLTLQLAFDDDLSHPEIANLRGEPLGTVKSRLRKTLRILRQALAS